MQGKGICPKCNGNGYRRIWKDQHETEKVTIQCSYCKSQGEIDITEEVAKELDQFESRRKQ